MPSSLKTEAKEVEKESHTPEVKVFLDAQPEKKIASPPPKDLKSDSGLIRNIEKENESKTSLKLEKSNKVSDWDMFADQDNYSVDVSNS